LENIERQPTRIAAYNGLAHNVDDAQTGRLSLRCPWLGARLAPAP